MENLKKNYTWRLNIELVAKIKQLAKKEHRSLTNYIENMLFKNIVENENETYGK